MRNKPYPISCLLILATTVAFLSSQELAAQQYTPKPGSPERKAIMNATRAAQQASVEFAVSYLSVFRDGTASIAIADLNDAAKQMPYGGLVFYESMNGRWRAIYSMYMDGSENCLMTTKLSEIMLSKAMAMGAPSNFFPPRFYSGYKAAVSSLTEDGNNSDCATTAIY